MAPDKMEKTLKGLIVAVILLALVLAYTLYRAQTIHSFLGSNQGEDRNKWHGLTGNYKENIIDLRNLLTDLTCRVTKLEPEHAECPPGGTVPKDDGGYPP